MIFSFSALIIPSASIYQSVLSDWQTMVDGFGGGAGASADPNQWLEDRMVYLVIGVIAVIGIVG